MQEQFENLAAELSFDGDCLVEIRFGALEYEFLWQLQSEELVDRALTLQTRASIRIVLCTLENFEREGSEMTVS